MKTVNNQTNTHTHTHTHHSFCAPLFSYTPSPTHTTHSRDPNDPEPYVPVRLPVVDFGGTKMDVNSRLLKDRIIMLGKGVDDSMANVVVSQLLYLANEDPEKDITLYINRYHPDSSCSTM